MILAVASSGVLSEFAAPSWGLRLNYSAVLQAPRLPSSDNADGLLSISDSWEYAGFRGFGMTRTS